MFELNIILTYHFNVASISYQLLFSPFNLICVFQLKLYCHKLSEKYCIWNRIEQIYLNMLKTIKYISTEI